MQPISGIRGNSVTCRLPKLMKRAEWFYLLIRKVDVRAMIQDAIERANSVDLENLQKEMDEEGNRVARKMYQVLD